MTQFSQNSDSLTSVADGSADGSMNQAFGIVPPRGAVLPLVISCPHSGTDIPRDLIPRFHPEVLRNLPDTDWAVHELYGFGPELGATLMHARYSRYVVDLNRDPQGQQLYNDGRRETGLVPMATFKGDPVYAGESSLPASEIEQRLTKYYWPYHQQLEHLLRTFKSKHRHVLLIEAHSIKRLVPTIRATPFADIILGDQMGQTAHHELTRTALASLTTGTPYQVAHNDPFRGGYITRHFGRPKEGIHAIQIEMSQDIYWDDECKSLKADAPHGIQSLLRQMISNILQTLEQLP